MWERRQAIAGMLSAAAEVSWEDGIRTTVRALPKQENNQMKIPKTVLVIGILCSVLLNFAYFFKGRSVARVPERRTSQRVQQVVRLKEDSAATWKGGIDRFNWREVESPDYRKYIENLRAIGCPEQTVGDIIVADVNSLFRLRWKQVLETNRLSSVFNVRVDPLVATKERLELRARELELEKRSILKELLGDNWQADEASMQVSASDVQQALLNFLPPEKQTNTLQLLRSFEARFDQDLKPRMGLGGLDEASRRTYVGFKMAKEAALNAALTPSEKEQFDLRFSQLASYLHNRFRYADLSEANFQKLFHFAKDYDLALDFYYNNAGDPEQFRNYAQAAQAVSDKARELARDNVNSRPADSNAHAFGLR